MNKIPVILFTLAAILFGIVLIFAGAVWPFEYSETSESHFQTYQQLEEWELIGKGWVPSFIPRSAYDINEKHKVDVGRINVKFRFRPGDAKEIEESCTEVKTKETNTQYYHCKHGNDVVLVKLRSDGTGEILSE